MTCIQIHNGFVCVSPHHKLTLSDGRRVFMSWHNYCGPMFYHDKNHEREINEWYLDDQINDALDWFINRGYRA